MIKDSYFETRLKNETKFGKIMSISTIYKYNCNIPENIIDGNF